MAWMIVSDSSCEIRELENPAPGVQFALVPFKIRVGEREYVDLATLNTQQMLQAMTDYNGASTTACPSPEEWAEYFLQADNVLAFTISSNLSGSYNAAMAAREMVLEEHPEKKIFVLDTLSCSGALAGAAAMALFSVPSNYFITYPAYVQFYHMPLEAILGMYQAILPSADSLIKCLVIFNMPFTLVKGLLDAVLCMLIYKPLSPILHGRK